MILERKSSVKSQLKARLLQKFYLVKSTGLSDILTLFVISFTMSLMNPQDWFTKQVTPCFAEHV